MRLTVLGNNGPYPGPGGACSGYLVEEGGTTVLLDCGNGVVSRLQKFTGIDTLGGIVVSHLHSDHMSDLMVLRYAIDIMLDKGTLNKPLRLYSPSGPEETFRGLLYKNVYEIVEVNEEARAEIGQLKFSFRRMEHPVPTYAVKIEGGGKTLVYSGDTSYNQGLIDFAGDCDLLLCECALMEMDRGENPVHLTASECGTIAKLASVKRLMITHLWPGYDANEVLNEVKTRYPDAELSLEMKTYSI
jgi:ribonuclease BN (tRNA processing enzyme)